MNAASDRRSRSILLLLLAAVAGLTFPACGKNPERTFARFIYGFATRSTFTLTTSGTEAEFDATYLKSYACGDETYEIKSMDGSFIISESGTKLIWDATEFEVTAKGGGMQESSSSSSSSSSSTATSASAYCKFKLQLSGFTTTTVTSGTTSIKSYFPSGTATITDCDGFSCLLSGVAIDCAKVNAELAKITSCSQMAD